MMISFSPGNSIHSKSYKRWYGIFGISVIESDHFTETKKKREREERI